MFQAISKPQAKSSEAVQREIEEAMSKVKETQSLVSAAVDPIMGMFGGMVGSGSLRSSQTRSRSRQVFWCTKVTSYISF
jgi:arginine/serine-rich splicing factor 12